MPTKRVGHRLVVLSATAAACTGAMTAPAVASENILAAGNGAYGNTMINMHREVTAAGETAHGSGVAGSLVQLPVNRPENGGGGGSLLFSDREWKTAVTAVVWER
ncbi:MULTISPECIES: hypothetical protein [unclassified Streptomyces]|uniref:hypothetical protein n=1 Tax=unclassified Streptomyces TaxID=2593676 RepID=UPI002DD7E7D0|nr:hypothetical protein [Streptomyces sp. NBC_01237]WRZ70444.1 hypothetical protein OG251_01820 [Streptomyces sp. NBC_01237]